MCVGPRSLGVGRGGRGRRGSRCRLRTGMAVRGLTVPPSQGAVVVRIRSRTQRTTAAPLLRRVPGDRPVLRHPSRVIARRAPLWPSRGAVIACRAAAVDARARHPGMARSRACEFVEIGRTLCRATACPSLAPLAELRGAAFLAAAALVVAVGIAAARIVKSLHRDAHRAPNHGSRCCTAVSLPISSRSACRSPSAVRSAGRGCRPG